MKITLSEQILRGNFGGETDDDQAKAADKYAELLKGQLTEFCLAAYPDAELEFALTVENASGCSRGFEVWIDGHDDGSDIEQAIENQYDWIVYNMEQSGEIYE